MKRIALNFLFLNVFLVFNASASLKEEVNKDVGIYLTKVQHAKELTSDPTPEMIKNVKMCAPCDLYGFYHVYKGPTKIGLFTLGDGSLSYYKNKARELGFEGGNWIERSLFLSPGHRGKVNAS